MEIKSLCIAYNRERSEPKIDLPIDFSHFLCHLRGKPAWKVVGHQQYCPPPSDAYGWNWMIWISVCTAIVCVVRPHIL